MIQAFGISKAYGPQKLFEDASFALDPGDRVGLVGRNGEGKSTLLKILARLEESDSGSVMIPRGYTIGYLAQHISVSAPTVLEEAELAFGDDSRKWTDRYKVEIILQGLGFSPEQFELPPTALSGGYQVRLMLAKVLLAENHLLLLDEPTNYLDILSLRWLSDFLRSWKGELILITHDRSFMDSITTSTMIIHRKRIRKFPGQTSQLYDQIAQEEELYEKQRQRDEARRREVQVFIDRFRAKASKARAVQSRIKALEKHERLGELQGLASLDFQFPVKPFPGKWVLHTEDVGFGYNDRDGLLFSGISVSIGARDRIGVVGANGKGKTTFLNVLAGEYEPSEGRIKRSDNMVQAYFGQTNIDRLNPKTTIEEELWAANPDLSRTAVRAVCGAMMFEGELAEKKISVLSGGERSRVLLGKLLVTPSNFLLLDEPTNHLDMDAIDSLLEAVEAYKGAVVLVTHSELLLRALATRLIVFDRGRASLFEGTYQDFLDRVGWASEAQTHPPKPNGDKKGDGALALSQKELREARSELDKRIRKLENDIVRQEDAQKDAEARLAQASAGQKVSEIERFSKLHHDARQKIEALFDELIQATEARARLD